jgi:hypothetical protein
MQPLKLEYLKKKLPTRRNGEEQPIKGKQFFIRSIANNVQRRLKTNAAAYISLTEKTSNISLIQSCSIKLFNFYFLL